MTESNDSKELTPAERKAAFKRTIRPYLFRLLIVIAISGVLAIAFNEIAFAFTREAFDRSAETIILEIPEGTAERVANGETPPEIPVDLTFVVGDTLEVVNKDSESHQLGPLFIPADTVARLTLDEPNRLSYTCSFRANQYLGIEVRQATTLGIRFTGLMLAAPTTTALFFLYSLVIFPIKPVV